MIKQRFLLMIAFVAFISLSALAIEPDMIVLQNGESLKVYNLDVTPADKVYYSLEEGDDAALLKIAKANILIIKKADGTVINPTETAFQADQTTKDTKPVNPDVHEPITCEATSDFTLDAKGNKIISIRDGNDQLLYMRLVTEEEKTLAVAPWQGKGKYEGEKYIIPEYVKIGNDLYTVTHIDNKAFYPGTKVDTKYLKRVIFPSTLKIIGADAFAYRSCLTTVVLPEGLEEIGDMAFRRACTENDIEQLYIPKSVKKIGSDAFRLVGRSTSPKGYFQGNLTSIPDFVNVSTCKKYGIDEEAVENYERKMGLRKD